MSRNVDKLSYMENTLKNQDYPMCPKDVAQYLHKSVRTVQNWIKRGELTGRKIGGSWFVMKSDIDRRIRRGA